jgi:hypothetical protein
VPKVRAYGHAKRALEAATVCLTAVGSSMGPDPDALLLEASTPTDPVCALGLEAWGLGCLGLGREEWSAFASRMCAFARCTRASQGVPSCGTQPAA